MLTLRMILWEHLRYYGDTVGEHKATQANNASFSLEMLAGRGLKDIDWIIISNFR
jgi:hypothetical protein